MTELPTIKLNTGAAMPQLGFGVFKVPPPEAEEVVAMALEVGYRSIDTATMYGNEAGVGAAIRAADIPRDELFIATKLNNDAHGTDAARRAFDESLQLLGLDQVDLYLIHWPLPRQDRYVETWRTLTQIAEDGRARAVGVSNFQLPHLQRLLDETGVVPAVNQIELHPQLTQDALRRFHDTHGVVTEAWSPLAKGGVLRDGTVTGIAEKYGRTPAQVVLRWHLQLGNVAIPKSVHRGRMVENFDVFGFELAPDDLAAISALNSDSRTGPNPDTFR
jgi:diketogulonate reductase-like aldo/keto reductase